MKITFIAHSAFLVEWDKFYTLFDYVYEPDYTGTLPPLDPQKPLLVFSSHSHEDHFDGKVFGLLEQYPLTQFFVSRDTRLTERRRKWLGISDEAFARTTVLRPDSILLTEAAGGESEGKAYCNNMAVHYKAAMEKLASAVRDEAADNGIAPAITAAMVPLDPRLGEEAEGLGLEWLLKNVEVLHAFPMHLWKRFETIDRFRAAYPALAARVVRITADGESFEV